MNTSKCRQRLLTKLSLRTIGKFFRKNFFQHFIYHKKILKVTKCQFNFICHSRVLDKNIPLWYNVSPLQPRVNRVKLWTQIQLRLRQNFINHEIKNLQKSALRQFHVKLKQKQNYTDPQNYKNHKEFIVCKNLI